MVFTIFVLALLHTSSSADTTCKSQLSSLFKSLLETPFSSNYSTMLQMSGATINSLGDFHSCIKMHDTNYVLFIHEFSPIVIQSLCGPAICTEEDYKSLEFFVSKFKFPQLHPLAVKINDPRKMSNIEEYGVIFSKDYQEENYGEYSRGAIAMITFISVVSIIIVITTIIEWIYWKGLENSKVGKVIKCFSCISNGKMFFSTRNNDGRSEIDYLEILNAVRVFGIGWVILGHVGIFGLIVPVNSNYNTAIKDATDANFIIVQAGFYAVDIFFWMSGFLAAYLFIIEIEKNRKLYLVKIFLAILHRFLRVIPVYMFCLFFFWTLQKHLGSGPGYVLIDEFFNADCQDYWYTNLVFLNNFIPEGRGSGCVEVGWYLANDMQFFIVAAIILVLYIKTSRVLGWTLIMLMCIIGCISAGIVSYLHGLNAMVFAMDKCQEYIEYYYTKPYTRSPPYFLGIACGIILYTVKHYKEKSVVYDKFAYKIVKCFENTYFRYIIFLLGWGIINVFIFTEFNTFNKPGQNYYFTHWSDSENNIYMTFNRFGFGLGLSLLLMPLLLGYFKPLANFMLYYPWCILAKLTFAIYLIHLPIIEIVWKSQGAAYNYGVYLNIQSTVFFFILSCFFAVLIVFGIEMPAANLEKLVLYQGKHEKNKKSRHTEDIENHSFKESNS